MTESESVQPLLSVTVYEYMPAYKESVFTTPPQSCVYPAVPPVIVNVTLPLFPPLHEILYPL